MDLLPLLAGLGLFMLGMKQLEEAIAALAGVTFRRFVRDHASTPMRGVAVGTAATAVLQSSSLVSLLVLAFVGAGILPLAGAIGVILGANLGTTATGWLVATLGFKLNLSTLALALVGAGGLGSVLLPRGGRLREFAALVAGLGLLLFGLDLMKQGVERFAAQFDVSPFSELPIWAMALLGVAVTSVIQSSTAAMMIALSALHGGVLALEPAAAFAAGTGVGTTLTAVIGAIGGAPDKKRVAAAHVGFNLFKASVALLILKPLLAALALVPALNDPLLRLAAFHTSINVIGIVLAWPMIGRSAAFLQRRFRGAHQLVNRYLHGAGAEVPEAAVEAVEKEARRGLCMAIGLNRYALRLHPPERSPWLDVDARDPADGRRSYGDRYERLKRLEGELAEYVIELETRELDADHLRRLHAQLQAVRDAVISAKSIKDIRANLVDLRMALREPTDRWLQRFEQQAEQFYQRLDALPAGQSETSVVEALSRLRNEIRETRDQVLAELYRSAGQHQLDELEFSTLLNVNRELHSSAKALLHGLNAHLLEPASLGVVEAASG
jgi:phosphate:Na+ symporter